MTPVLIDPDALEPIEGDPQACRQCTRVEARWTLLSGHPICSVCVIYETPWGIENKEGINKLFAEVSKVLGREANLLEIDGALSCEAANRLLGSIVLTSKFRAKLMPKP